MKRIDKWVTFHHIQLKATDQYKNLVQVTQKPIKKV